MAVRPRPGPPEPRSVSQFAREIDEWLKRAFPGPVRVVGEVSGWRDRTHWYFDLKDENAVINCVAFANVARRTGFTIRDGELVIVSGRVEYYAKGGKVSFLVDSIERAGEGPLDRRFRELCDQLRAEGFFDPARKRPLPRFPRRVAVVTSRSGAALQDVIETTRRRCPAVGLVVVDVPVQGDQAADAIAHALHALSRRYRDLGIDAIILTRGGGSKEDLWCFNERVVAEAVLRCAVPVVAAIGHETDTTIAELVADERGSTPTQAAMRLTPDRAELSRQLQSVTRRAQHAVERRLEQALGAARLSLRRAFSGIAQAVHRDGQRLASLHVRLERLRPQALHAASASALREAERRLQDVMRRRIEQASPETIVRRLAHAADAIASVRRRDLDALQRHLAAVAPVSVLERGFSITLDTAGRAVRRASDVSPGDSLETVLAEGRVRSRVDSTSPHGSVSRRASSGGSSGASSAAQPPSRARSTRSKPAEGPGLFEHPPSSDA